MTIERFFIRTRLIKLSAHPIRNLTPIPMMLLGMVTGQLALQGNSMKPGAVGLLTVIGIICLVFIACVLTADILHVKRERRSEKQILNAMRMTEQRSGELYD